jgi:hypothetical protein
VSVDLSAESAAILLGVRLREFEQQERLDADERAHEASGDKVVALVSLDSVNRDAFASMSEARREALRDKGIPLCAAAIDLAFAPRDKVASTITDEEFQTMQREQLGIWCDADGKWWCVPPSCLPSR